MPVHPAPPARDDAGFTLAEVLVATAIIAVVMLGLGAVFVATAAGTDQGGHRQTAARLATGGMDRVHALAGPGVVKGRDRAAVTAQWSAKPAGVVPLVAGLSPAYDGSAPAGSGATAALPTSPVTSTVDGLAFTQSFYVASCQLDATSTCRATAGTGTVPMFQVVVAVAWTDKGCARNACSYQLSTLMAASSTDPVFDIHDSPVAPSVTTNAPASGVVQDVGENAVGQVLVDAVGGNGRRTFTASGLPGGVTIDPGTGQFIGTVSAVTARSTVTVTVSDEFGLSDSASFAWTVNPRPALTAAARTVTAATTAMTPVDLASALRLTGGTAPFSWSCAGLPAVVKLASGTLTGTLATAGVVTVTCTVTDARAVTASAALTLTVLDPVKVISPADRGTAILLRTRDVKDAAVATGCNVACTWSASPLPPGVTVGRTGAISGRPTTIGRWTVVFTATDALGRKGTSTVVWTVL